MGKIRRGGYVIRFWKTDHAPRHVHVYRDGKLVVKWNLEDQIVMKGRPPARVIELITTLQREGLL